MPVHCSFKHCRNSPNACLFNRTAFYTFPTHHPALCKTWIRYAEKPHYLNLGLGKLSKEVICSDHFEDTWFLDHNNQRLHPLAFPTLDGFNQAYYFPDVDPLEDQLRNLGDPLKPDSPRDLNVPQQDSEVPSTVHSLNLQEELQLVQQKPKESSELLQTSQQQTRKVETVSLMKMTTANYTKSFEIMRQSKSTEQVSEMIMEIPEKENCIELSREVSINKKSLLTNSPKQRQYSEVTNKRNGQSELKRKFSPNVLKREISSNNRKTGIIYNNNNNLKKSSQNEICSVDIFKAIEYEPETRTAVFDTKDNSTNTSVDPGVEAALEVLRGRLPSTFFTLLQYNVGQTPPTSKEDFECFSELYKKSPEAYKMLTDKYNWFLPSMQLLELRDSEWIDYSDLPRISDISRF